MKKFCKDLREHSAKIINYEKKKMISLTMEEKIHYNKQKVCYICKKEFDNNDKKQKEIIVTTQVSIEVQLIIFVI